MLDSEYVDRVDKELYEDGALARDDHEGIWEGLKCAEIRCSQLEYAISLITSKSVEELLDLARKTAHRKYPALSPDEALECELRRRHEHHEAAQLMAWRDHLQQLWSE